MMNWRIALTLAILLGTCPAGAQDFFPGPSPGRPVPAGLDGADLSVPARSASPDIMPLQPGNSTGSGYPGPPLRSQGPTGPADFTSIRHEAAPVGPERFTESTWYTRVDYFHWNERLDGTDFVNEFGVLPTVGYQRRVGPERFRFELFGSTLFGPTVHYKGAAMFDDGSSEPLSSTTNLLGVRGEIDLLFEPEIWPQISFFLGLGTRFWVRDLKDGFSSITLSPVTGYQETWWTIYPYLGVEKRRVLSDGLEFYGSGRIGCTAVTYQRVSYFDVTLYPKAGLTGQLEAGLRSRRLLLAAFFEAFAWSQSEIVRDTLQPNSRMYTIGLKTGFSF
jgi:hypothetical protein